MSRPELQAPPELYYNETESKKYAANSRILQIQTQMSERCVQLLQLPEDLANYLWSEQKYVAFNDHNILAWTSINMLVQSSCLVLDIGCGAGLSGDVLTEQGHVWIGIDIAPAMLEQSLERECEGDVLLRDMGHGLPFRPASFDAAISVSAIQWLLHAYKAEQNPRRRLMAFFQSLYNCLSRGAKAVLQFYPEDPAQMELVTSSAMRCGFTGGLVVDYPNSTRAKKYFLCLFAGESSAPLPQPLGVDEVGEPAHEVAYIKRQQQKRKRMLEGKRASVKSRAWILKKKEKARVKGQVVPKDTKYTGRRRPAAF